MIGNDGWIIIGRTFCKVVGCLILAEIFQLGDYVLKRMDDISNQMWGQIQYERGVHIITYDRLVDNILRLGNGF